MKDRLFVAALLGWAWMAVAGGCGDGTSDQSSAPRLAVFVVSDQESATYSISRVTPDGRAIYTSDEPLVTEREVAQLHVGEFSSGFPMLTLDLTDVGIRKLADRAEEYVDHELAIMWDSQVVSVPKIKNPLSNQIAIVSSGWLPASKLEAIAEYLNIRQSTPAERR